MVTYLVLGTYTAQGRAGLVEEGGTARFDETKRLFEDQLGGRVIYYSFLQGRYDFILLVELADDLTFLAPVLLATAGGAITIDTCRVVSPAELDEIAEKARSIKFRSAGE